MEAMGLQTRSIPHLRKHEPILVLSWSARFLHYYGAESGGLHLFRSVDLCRH